MIPVDHPGGAIDVGFAVKESEAVRPVSKLFAVPVRLIKNYNRKSLILSDSRFCSLRATLRACGGLAHSYVLNPYTYW